MPGPPVLGLGRAGIKSKEVASQTLDFDDVKNTSKGMNKAALNVVFGTNEDFSGVQSGSGENGGILASWINVAKDGDNEEIVQFEFVQALTFQSKLLNAFKDAFYTNWLSAAMDGTSRSMKAANVMTLGGFWAMESKVRRYSDPDQ